MSRVPHCASLAVAYGAGAARSQSAVAITRLAFRGILVFVWTDQEHSPHREAGVCGACIAECHHASTYFIPFRSGIADRDSFSQASFSSSVSGGTIGQAAQPAFQQSTMATLHRDRFRRCRTWATVCEGLGGKSAANFFPSLRLDGHGP